MAIYINITEHEEALCVCEEMNTLAHYNKMVAMIWISLKKCRELYLIEEYF